MVQMGKKLKICQPCRFEKQKWSEIGSGDLQWSCGEGVPRLVTPTVLGP